MLKELKINNFALIDNLQVNFDEGFSIITGETGAGKSIILGALGLILGNRADLKNLKNEAKKCLIEGVFDISRYDLKDFFMQNDLEFDDETIIRREIYPTGKSRSFINDTPTRLDLLQVLGKKLIDIHSQHQTLQLADSDFQFSVIDFISNNLENIDIYKKTLKKYNKSKNDLEELRNRQSEIIKSFEYNSFLLKEILNANIFKGEKTEKEEELKILSNAEEIKSILSEAISILSEENFGIIQSINNLTFKLRSISNDSKEIRSIFDRIESIGIEIKDVLIDFETIFDKTEYNQYLISELNERLNLIYNLEKKHNCSSETELIEIAEKLNKEVSEVENLEQTIFEAKKNTSIYLSDLNKVAEKIYLNRNKNKKNVAQKIVSVLKNLGIPDAELIIKLTKSEVFFHNGKDEINYLFSANKGGSLNELNKASGGELSRVMLGIKAVLAEAKNMPTIIFDEIDTGVSGEIAGKIGDTMNQMSARMQVVSITHLPQIAGKGTHHFRVYKYESKNQTHTAMKKLNYEDRIDELAKMLSNNNITESAKKHAEELLNFQVKPIKS